MTGHHSARPVFLVFAVGFLIAAGITVLAVSGGSSRHDGNARPTDMQDEYAQALRYLEFPPGRTPRPEDPGANTGEAYEPGTGAIDAANAWFCAWALEWDRNRKSDPARATAALEKLAVSYPDGLFWRSLAKPDGVGLKAEIDQAMTGNIPAMQREIPAFGCTP